MFEKFKNRAMSLAELVDAWRIVPRVVLVAYGWLFFYMVDWFKQMPTYEKTHCDSSTMAVLLERNVDLELASNIACSVVDVVGGPTTAHSALVSVIAGAAAVVIGLYVNSGKKWDSSSKSAD